jgi:lipid-A-disaccharide synthase
MQIFLSAGDPSGDIAAQRAVAAMQSLHPDVHFFGLGGDKLGALGQEQFAKPSELAVLGFWEVAKRILFFRRLFHKCLDEIDRRRPDCAVLVDYPGFNLRLAKEIKKRGIPIVYYIAPQVWAWGKGRIHDIRELVDLLLVILPFEQKYFTTANVRHEFVGHYLLEDIPRAYISSPIPSSRLLAVLPGSRHQEIDRMLAPMLASAVKFCSQSGFRVQIAAIRGAYDYESAAAQHNDAPIEIIYDDSRRVLYESECALVASGTATLEAGIIGRPMVITYRTSWSTYQIAKRLIDLDSIGLVNLTAGKKIVPELIQGAMTPVKVCQSLADISSPNQSRAIKIELDKIPSLLGGEGASQRVASAILRVCKERG